MEINKFCIVRIKRAEHPAFLYEIKDTVDPVTNKVTGVALVALPDGILKYIAVERVKLVETTDIEEIMNMIESYTEGPIHDDLDESDPCQGCLNYAGGKCKITDEDHETSFGYLNIVGDEDEDPEWASWCFCPHLIP